MLTLPYENDISFSYKFNSFSYEWLYTWPLFDKQVYGNSKMGYEPNGHVGGRKLFIARKCTETNLCNPHKVKKHFANELIYSLLRFLYLIKAISSDLSLSCSNHFVLPFVNFWPTSLRIPDIP